MPLFHLYIMGFVQKMTKHGRFADLLVGVVTLALAVYWHSPITAVFGLIGVAAFAFDLNGRIQRRTLAFAHARAVARRR